MMGDTALAIVEDILTELNTRIGFDYWWEDIDPEDKQEIKVALFDKVFANLEQMS